MSDKYYSESDIKDFEKVESMDSAVLLREVKALREEIRELKENNRREKSPAQKKKEILSIKDTKKRLEAISENIDLFR